MIKYTLRKDSKNNMGQHLNEEKYLQAKNKLLSIAKTVLISGLVLAGLLIGIGIFNIANIKDGGSDARPASEIQADIDKLNGEIAEIDKDLASLKGEQNTIFKTEGFSEKYYLLGTDISNKSSEKMEKKEKVDTLKKELEGESDIEKTSRGIFSVASVAPFFIFGFFIIFATLIISGSIFMFAKRREITAFTVQQHLPVVKETVEEVTPIASKAIKTMVDEVSPSTNKAIKDLTKSIKEGINEADEEAAAKKSQKK